MGPFIDALPCGLTVDSSIDDFKAAYDKSGYKSKIETIVNKLWTVEMFTEYYEEKCKCHNKTYLAKDEYELIRKMDADIKDNTYAEYYFKPQQDYEKSLKQYAIYFDYMGEECKSLLDLVFINEKDRYIQPLDLKTTANLSSFKKSFLRLGYYVQAGFYHIAVD